jgi:hypothetical protein
MTTQANITVIVERPDVLLSLAFLVEEQIRNVEQIKANFKAGLYADQDAYECDLEDASDSHIIAFVAYRAALQLIKGKHINDEQDTSLKAALCMTGAL